MIMLGRAWRERSRRPDRRKINTFSVFMSKLLAARRYYGIRFRRKCGWPMRRLTAASRALPDFLILGAAKAGTTSLFELIMQHPLAIPVHP